MITDSSMITVKNILYVAQACHEVNRAYCLAIGDHSQLPWNDAPEWQRTSCINGVGGVLEGNGPEESHKAWLAEKAAAGWAWGPVKDAEKKVHPCFVPYDRLPPEQKKKDDLFVATARAMLIALGELTIIPDLSSEYPRYKLRETNMSNNRLPLPLPPPYPFTTCTVDGATSVVLLGDSRICWHTEAGVMKELSAIEVQRLAATVIALHLEPLLIYGHSMTAQPFTVA